MEKLLKMALPSSLKLKFGCFPISKGSPGSLAMRHLLDVSTLSPGLLPFGFRVEPCFRLYSRCNIGTFASSGFFLPPHLQHALR